MLYKEIIAVCSEIHTKHTNTLCGQNVESFSVISSGAEWPLGLQNRQQAHAMCALPKPFF